MRDTADAPASEAEALPATRHDPPTPDTPPAPQPEPQPTPDAQDDPRPARVHGGPAAAIAAEATTAAGAALYNTIGWAGLGLGAAALAGGAALVVGGVRRHRSPWKTRSWSTTSRRTGSTSTGGGSSSARKSSRMPSLKGAGAGRGSGARGTGRAGAGGRAAGAGRRGRSAMPAGFGTGRATGRPGGPRTAAGRTARRAAHATGPAVRGTARAARRANRAAHNGLDRVADGAARNGRAARAAGRAMRSGGTARDAARAARASLRDSHAQPRTQRRWRRMLGAGAWAVTAFGAGIAYRLGGRAWARIRRRRPTLPTPPPSRPRIETTVHRPTATAGRTRGEDTMAKRSAGVPPFVAAAEEFAETLRRYEPPPGAGGMVRMYSDVGMLPDALEQIAAGVVTMADRCRSEWPLHPAVAEMIGEVAKVLAQTASVAAEVKPAIERLHEPELERARAPRPSEDRWNV